METTRLKVIQRGGGIRKGVGNRVLGGRRDYSPYINRHNLMTTLSADRGDREI